MPNGKLLPRFSGQGNPQPHVGVSTHVFSFLSPFLPPTVVSWFAWSDFERGEMEIEQASKRKPRRCNFTPLSQAESHWGFTQPRASKKCMNTCWELFLTVIDKDAWGTRSCETNTPQIAGTIAARSSCWGEDERDAYLNTIRTWSTIKQAKNSDISRPEAIIS